MAYFNHAFQKTILALDGTIATGKKLWELNDAAVVDGVRGSMIGIVGTDGDDKDKVIAGDGTKPFMIAGTTLREKDKLGKFMAGFQSLNTSKKINPKYINGFYVVAPQEAKNAYVTVGAATDEDTGELTICDYDFDCGKNYYLQLDVKGNVVASTLMHNYHKRIPAYISCCGVDDASTETVETAVAAIKIYYEWAKYIKKDPMTEGLIEPVIVAGDVTYTQDGITLADGTTTKKFASSDKDEDTLEKAIAAATAEKPLTGYLKVIAAFESTTFSDCVFDANEANELQPLEILASMTDDSGNVCFDGVCIEIVAGQQKTRTGESLLKELILDESYHQRWLSSDYRKREIDGSGALISKIDRTAQYPGVYLLHSVPRFNNPSGTFDNDQYLIQIITEGTVTVTTDAEGNETITMDGNLNTIVKALETATDLTAEVYTK